MPTHGPTESRYGALGILVNNYIHTQSNATQALSGGVAVLYVFAQ